MSFLLNSSFQRLCSRHKPQVIAAFSEKSILSSEHYTASFNIEAVKSILMIPSTLQNVVILMCTLLKEHKDDLNLTNQSIYCKTGKR